MEKPADQIPVDSSCMQSASFGWQKSTWLIYFSGVTIALWIVVPYVTAVARGDVHPFLPFISQAAGIPPQTGIFTVLGAIVAVVAIVLGFLRFAFVYCNIGGKATWTSALNYLALLVCVIAAFGLIVATGYPIWFEEGKDGWLFNVLIPHAASASTLIVGMLIYMFFQAILTYLVEGFQRKALLFVRSAIVIVYFVMSCLVAGVIRKSIIQPQNATEFVYSIPKEYNDYYLISSVCEWMFPLMIVLYLLTFASDFRDLSVSLRVRCKATPSTVSKMSLSSVEGKT